MHGAMLGWPDSQQERWKQTTGGEVVDTFNRTEKTLKGRESGFLPSRGLRRVDEEQGTGCDHSAQGADQQLAMNPVETKQPRLSL